MPCSLARASKIALERGRAAEAGHELFEFELAQAHIQIGDSGVLARVDAERPLHLALREGHRRRIEREDALRELDLRVRRAQREIARDDLVGAIVHVGIHLPETVDVERLIGENACRRLLPACIRFLFGRCGFAGTRRGRHAERRPKVVEIEGARFDVARQVRTFARCIDLDRAVDIRVADLSVEPTEAPLVTGTGEIAGDAIGRRVGKRETCEIVELGQVRAREHNIDGERAEIERPRQRAVGDDAGVARAHIALEAIGLVRVDIEQRIACQLQCEGPPIELPLSVKVK